MNDSVLLLDGDDRDADQLERALESRGWIVVRARDFASAILAFESARPSVALVAVDHFEGGLFLAAIRGREDAAGFPVVLIDSPAAASGIHETRRSQAPIRPEDAVLLRPLVVEDVTAQLRWLIAFASTASSRAAASEPPAQFDPAADQPTEMFQAVDRDEQRVAIAAEEAVRAAYDETFEREERLHRWTREREEERRQTEALEVPQIDFAESLVRAALRIDPALQIDLRSLPAETEADRIFARALATGSSLQTAAEKSDLSLDRARAIVALALLREGVEVTAPAAPSVDLAAWLAEHKDLDYFAILGLPRAASPDAAAAALARLQVELRLTDRVGDPLADAVLRLLEEAHAVVSSPVLSAAYRNNLGNDPR